MEIISSRRKKNEFRWSFYGKWVGGYREGLVLEIRMLVNASGIPGCGISRYSEKSQNPEAVISSRKRYSLKWCFYDNRTTNRKDGNDRKVQEKMSRFHQKITLCWFLQVKFLLFMKTSIFSCLYGYFISSGNPVLAGNCWGRTLIFQP